MKDDENYINPLDLLVGESRKRWIVMFGDEEDKKDGG